MTIKCKICGHETIDDGRIMHGHFMKMHPEEYEEAGFILEAVTTGYTKKVRNGSQVKPDIKHSQPKELPLITLRPINLRLLNKNKAVELQAYNEGYRYIDPDEMIAYTLEEVKEEGWL